MDHDNFQKIKDDIALAAAGHAAFDGWHWQCVLDGARDAGHPDEIVRDAFPEKLSSVLDHFADLADREMLAGLADFNPDEMRVRDKVAEAVMARYRFLNVHKEAERRALQYWICPLRKPHGIKILWRTCDRVWDYAGDVATDYNRYTKRGLLAGVIVSTTLVWLNDHEEDLAQTRAFLDRRIENVLKIGGAVGRILGRMKR